MSAAPRLHLKLRPSPGLAAAILAAHAAAAVAVAAVLDGTLPGLAVGGLLLCVGAAAAWRIAMLRAGRSAVELDLGADGGWRARLRSGEWVEGGGRRRVTGWWVTLGTADRRAGTLLVARGMAPADDFRRLRVWALWRRAPAVTPVR